MAFHFSGSDFCNSLLLSDIPANVVFSELDLKHVSFRCLFLYSLSCCLPLTDLWNWPDLVWKNLEHRIDTLGIGNGAIEMHNYLSAIVLSQVDSSIVAAFHQAPPLVCPHWDWFYQLCCCLPYLFSILCYVVLLVHFVSKELTFAFNHCLVQIWSLYYLSGFLFCCILSCCHCYFYLSFSHSLWWSGLVEFGSFQFELFAILILFEMILPK